MDTIINPVSGVTRILSPVVSKQDTDSIFPAHKNSVEVTQRDTSGDADAHYEKALRKAALSFSDTYAISDKSFTIFKDSEGKYITRYTSLRDGRVTYIPEPTLLRQIQATTTLKTAILSITA